jgi:hypothetical protein
MQESLFRRPARDRGKSASLKYSRLLVMAGRFIFERRLNGEPIVPQAEFFTIPVRYPLAILTTIH